MSHLKYLVALGSLAFGVAFAASSYHVTVSDPLWVNGKQLQPGDYRVQLETGKVMITGHNSKVEVPAQIQTAAAKHRVTALQSEDVNGKQQLERIDVGGTKTSIILKSGSTAASGE